MSLKNKFRGGGFLNNVDVKVSDVNWVVGETYPIKKGKNVGKDFTPLNLVAELTPEGASEPTVQKLFVGNAENMTFEISDDGKTIEFSQGGLYPNCEAGVFLNSCENPEHGDLQITDFGDEDNKDLIDVTSLVGVRMRVVRVVNPDRPKQKDAKDPKKLWDAKDLQCAEVYELGGEAPAPTKKGGKVATKGKAVVETDDDDDDVTPEDAAKIALLRYLEAASGGVLPIAKLKTKVATDETFAKNAALRKTVGNLLADVDFLKTIDEVETNGKKQTVTLAEVAA